MELNYRRTEEELEQMDLTCVCSWVVLNFHCHLWKPLLELESRVPSDNSTWPTPMAGRRSWRLPVKERATELGIQVLTPDGSWLLGSYFHLYVKLNQSFIVSGKQEIPEEVPWYTQIWMFEWSTIFTASYWGGNPIQRQIMAGETEREFQ